MANEIINIINELCVKFGVGAEDLINELYNYYTTISIIGIVFWGIVLVIITLICKRLWKKHEELFETDDSFCLFFSIVIISIIIVLYFVGICVICSSILNLISWNISPVGAMFELIGEW